MRYVDVFNGDADGLCALHQLRLDFRCPSASWLTTNGDERLSGHAWIGHYSEILEQSTAFIREESNAASAAR